MSTDIRLPPVQARTCRIGGETRRRGAFALRGWNLALACVVGLIGLVLVLVTRSWFVVIVELAVVAAVAVATSSR